MWWEIMLAPACVLGALGLLRWAIAEWRFAGLAATALLWTFVQPAMLVIASAYGLWIAFAVAREVLAIPEVRERIRNIDLRLPEIPIPTFDERSASPAKVDIESILTSLRHNAERISPMSKTPKKHENESRTWTQATPEPPASIPPPGGDFH